MISLARFHLKTVKSEIPPASVRTDLKRQFVLKLKLGADLLVAAHLHHSQLCPSEVPDASISGHLPLYPKHGEQLSICLTENFRGDVKTAGGRRCPGLILQPASLYAGTIFYEAV